MNTKRDNIRFGFGLAGILIVVAIIVLAYAGGYWWFTQRLLENDGDQVCTQDAKVCPDGSSVGRTGQNCEFTKCPSGEDADIIFGDEAERLCGPQPPLLCRPDRKLGCRRQDKQWNCYPVIDTSTWKIYRNEEYGFEVRYPSTWVIRTGTDNITGKIVSVSLDRAYQRGDTKIPSASIQFFIQRNSNPKKLSLNEWYDSELLKIQSIPPSKIETTIGGEPAILWETSGAFGKKYKLFIAPVDQTNVLTITYSSQSESNPIYLAILSTFKFTK